MLDVLELERLDVLELERLELDRLEVLELDRLDVELLLSIIGACVSSAIANRFKSVPVSVPLEVAHCTLIVYVPGASVELVRPYRTMFAMSDDPDIVRWNPEVSATLLISRENVLLAELLLTTCKLHAAKICAVRVRVIVTERPSMSSSEALVVVSLGN